MPRESTPSIFSKKAKSGTDAIAGNGTKPDLNKVGQLIAFGDDKPKYTEPESLKIGHWAF